MLLIRITSFFVFQIAFVSGVHGPDDVVPEGFYSDEDGVPTPLSAQGSASALNKADKDYAKRTKNYEKRDKQLKQQNEQNAKIEQAKKEAAAAERAAKDLTGATAKIEWANKKYKETMEKIAELRTLLEKKRTQLEAKMAKSTTGGADADRDELDQLNELIEDMVEKANKNKRSMEKAKKLVAEQMLRAEAFFVQADKSLSTLRKLSAKQFRGRDRDWVDAEQARLMNAQEKLQKLQKAAGIHQEALMRVKFNVPEGEELKDLSPAALAQIETALSSGTEELENQLKGYAETEQQLVDAEERQKALRDSIAHRQRDGTHSSHQTYGRDRVHHELPDEEAREQASKDLAERKAALEEKRSLIAAKRKQKEEEEKANAVSLTPEEKAALLEEKKAADLKRRLAQKKRIQANIERAIAIEIEVQRKRMEHEKKLNAVSHHLKVKLGKQSQPAAASKMKDLPPSIHFDEDIDDEYLSPLAAPASPGDKMSAEDEEAVKKKLQDIATEQDPTSLDIPKGRSLLEGSSDDRTIQVSKGFQLAGELLAKEF